MQGTYNKYANNSEQVSIVATSLVKKFDQTMVVDNVSFAATKGEVVGFLGPNGAGKSTTMRMLAGFILPTSGNAYINGYSIVDHPKLAKAQLGYLPEGSPLYVDMSVQSFLTFIAKLHNLSGVQLRTSLDEMACLLELTSVWYKKIESLSKGFKRRVGLAAALIHAPSVLILDEPTDGLDPNQKFKVRELIKDLARNKIILISTHLLEEVELVCNRAMLISDGRIISDATPKTLIESSPLHNTIIMTVRNTDAIDISNTLSSVDFIENIEILDNSLAQISVSIRSKQGSLDNLNTLIAKTGWDLQDLYVRRGQLEDVFRTMTKAK